MGTKIAKCISIAALLVAVWWRSYPSYRVVLAFVICSSAIIIARQAARAQRYFWVSVFALIALMFNPIWMVRLSATYSLWLDVVCLTAFAASLLLIKSQPLLSIPSITDRTPGSESL